MSAPATEVTVFQGRPLVLPIEFRAKNGGPISLPSAIEVRFRGFKASSDFAVANQANGKVSGVQGDGSPAASVTVTLSAADLSPAPIGYGSAEIVDLSADRPVAVIPLRIVSPGTPYAAEFGRKFTVWAEQVVVVVDILQNATTDMVAEGSSNQYFTPGRVLITVLTGFSAAVNGVVSAADTVLSALGRLQAQITSNLTAATAALATKAPLDSPVLVGTPTAPTAAAGTNTSQIATTGFVKTAVADLVASSPAALDTLNELATALGDDPNFAATMTNALAAKAPLASPVFTDHPTAPTAVPDTNTTQLATTSFAKKEADDAEAAAKAHSVQRVNHTGEQAISTITGLQAALDGKEVAGTAAGWITAHVETADPHAQYALESEVAATYATTAALSAHSARTDNPHAVTKTQVGLGSVDNTSDANKPVSTATQAALNAKQEILVSGTNIKTVNGLSIMGPGNLVVGGGSGSGDMSMSIYDTDSDGVVDAAETAPWFGIIGKPSTYPPDTHTHTKSSITDFAEVTENAKTSAYTLEIGDAGKMVTMASATAVTLTVPTNASVSYPIGTRIDILSLGAGDVSVAGDVGVTVQSLGAKLKLGGQYAGATLWKQATNVWVLIGALKS